VLMLEALAQAAAILGYESLSGSSDANMLFYFAGIDNARFKRPVEPGDQMIMNVTLDRMRAGIVKFKARTTVDDDLVVEADLLCTMRAAI